MTEESFPPHSHPQNQPSRFTQWNRGIQWLWYWMKWMVLILKFPVTVFSRSIGKHGIIACLAICNICQQNNTECNAPPLQRKHETWTELTVSDVLPCPLVVLEERMSLDLIHPVATQSYLPGDKLKTQEQRTYSLAILPSTDNVHY